MESSKIIYWFRCALIRAIKTMAQTAIATIGTTMAINEIDWLMVGSTSLVAGLLSILTSIATGLPEVEQKQELDSMREARRLNGQD